MKVKNPMDADEAQALADRAVSVVAGAGQAERHGFLTLRLHQALTHSSGTRPAAEIAEGDTVQLERDMRPLHVFGLIRERDEGTLQVVLADEHHGERAELELTFMRLERGA